MLFLNEIPTMSIHWRLWRLALEGKLFNTARLRGFRRRSWETMAFEMMAFTVLVGVAFSISSRRLMGDDGGCWDLRNDARILEI